MVQSDVDPKPIIEKQCHTPCVAYWNEYLACGQRIQGKKEATCEPQYFDYWKCVDKCVRNRAAFPVGCVVYGCAGACATVVVDVIGLAAVDCWCWPRHTDDVARCAAPQTAKTLFSKLK